MSIFGIIRVVMAALHDVSKHDDTRLDPKANASDTRAQRDATNTTSIHPVTDATTTKGFLQTGSGRMVGNDGLNNVGLFGFDSTGTMVVKVAKAGFDADTASNSNLIFNSSQNVFKIVATGSVDLSISGPGQSTVDVAHNQSFIPTVLAYASMPLIQSGSQFLVPFQQLANNSGVGAQYVINRSIQLAVNSTNMRFWLASGNTETFAATVKYYILQETAN